MTSELNFIDLLLQAGISIVAIGALSVLAVAVALERFWTFMPQNIAPPDLVPRFLEHWRASDLSGARALVADHPSVLGQVLAYLLQHRDRPVATLSVRAGEMASLALRRHQRKAYPLVVVSTVAPLVGLLGTVIGMIEAFHVIATAGGLGDPTQLAGGISKALVNTAAGLAVALPALALHHWFKHRLTGVGLRLEADVNQVLDALVTPVEAARAG
ncbi:MAG: MotA/TolQ/ExbB proton channel family protein [Rubrivivax sp.]